MPDDDHTKARAYLEFTKVLHEVESTVHAIPREAMKTDPHGLGSTVKLAERLDRKMERMSDVLREMVYYRQDGVETLVLAVQEGDVWFSLL